MVFDTMLVCHFVDPNLVVAIIFVRKEQQKKRGLILEQGSETHRTLLGVADLQSPPTLLMFFW